MKIILRTITERSGFAYLYHKIFTELKKNKRVENIILIPQETNEFPQNINSSEYVLLDCRLAQHWDHEHDYKLKVGFSMSETDRVSLHWVRSCNKMDGVIVPTEFNEGTYKASGVISSVKGIFPGVEDFKWNDKNNNIRNGMIKKGLFPRNILSKYKFFSSGQWLPWYGSRKNWEGLIEAYVNTFSKNDNVCFIMKPFGNFNVDCAKEMVDYKLYKIGKEDVPEIIVINQFLERDEMECLFDICDCYCGVSHGEGLGLDFVSAVQHNKPIITTKFSSLPYFLENDKIFWVEPDGLEKVPPEIIYFSGLAQSSDHMWAKIKEEDVSKQMINCFENKIKRVEYKPLKNISVGVNEMLNFIEKL